MSCDFTGQNLVFVAGCPRSGTTYLQRLLAALPFVKTGQESHLFSLIGPLWETWRTQAKFAENGLRGGVGLPLYFNEAEYKNVLKDFLFQLLKPMVGSLNSREIFVEKTPSNALYLGTIHELLPQARIILIQRDARDVVASLLAASRSWWGKAWAPSSPIKAARLWCVHLNRAKQSAQHLPASVFYKIKYEDIVTDPTMWLTNISVFLGLNSSKEDIENAVRENSLEAARITGGTKIPVGVKSVKSNCSFVTEPDGFIRRGKPNGWKTDLTLIEKFCVWYIARSAMKQSGYSWRWPW